MAKSDRDHAQQLLEMASKDYQALTNMLDKDNFAEEIFGFHAQLSVLIRILKDAGEDLSNFPDLEDYTIYAVQYRYEAYDEAEDRLDRVMVISKTEAFVAHVRGIIDSTMR